MSTQMLPVYCINNLSNKLALCDLQRYLISLSDANVLNILQTSPSCVLVLFSSVPKNLSSTLFNIVPFSPDIHSSEDLQLLLASANNLPDHANNDQDLDNDENDYINQVLEDPYDFSEIYTASFISANDENDDNESPLDTSVLLFGLDTKNVLLESKDVLDSGNDNILNIGNDELDSGNDDALDSAKDESDSGNDDALDSAKDVLDSGNDDALDSGNDELDSGKDNVLDSAKDELDSGKDDDFDTPKGELVGSSNQNDIQLLTKKDASLLSASLDSDDSLSTKDEEGDTELYNFEDVQASQKTNCSECEDQNISTIANQNNTNLHESYASQVARGILKLEAFSEHIGIKSHVVSLDSKLKATERFKQALTYFKVPDRIETVKSAIIQSSPEIVGKKTIELFSFFSRVKEIVVAERFNRQDEDIKMLAPAN